MFVFSGHKLELKSFIIMLYACLFIQGCSGINSYEPLPQNLEAQVQVPGFHDIRAWGDAPSKGMYQSARASIEQEKAANHGELHTEVDALALSGGGADGAFGAGVLCGWSKAGTRPTFKLVTGISTGALIAPFAFLGSAYDEKLKIAYTTMSDDTIYKRYGIFSILLSLANISSLPSLADNKGLADMIAKQVDERMLKEIAAEHLKGRRLIVGTTQINSQRLVIWNMGAIAASGSPHALELFRKILLASASIPVTFPPQYFNVKAAGKAFTEMHVDGGIEAQVMLYENAIRPFYRKGEVLKGSARVRKLYIIRNQKVTTEWQYVEPKLTKIAIRSIDSLTKSQGIGDLYRLYLYSQRDEMDYNLAYIPRTFKTTPKSPFDNAYMRKLFALGYKMGSSGFEWSKYPPEFNPN